MAVIYLLDTNVLLSDPSVACLLADQESRAIVLKPVFEELDALKADDGLTGVQARQASRELERMVRECSKTGGGWLVRSEPACIFIIDEATDKRISPEDRRSVDDCILACTQEYLDQAARTGDQVFLVSMDRNLRIRAAGREIPTINPAEWIRCAPNRYLLPIATRCPALDENRPWHFTIGLEDGQTGLLEIIPHEPLRTRTGREQLDFRFLASGEYPVYRFGNRRDNDRIPYLTILAKEDKPLSDAEPYARAKQLNCRPDSQPATLYHRNTHSPSGAATSRWTNCAISCGNRGASSSRSSRCWWWVSSAWA